jgi:hypothetical protein
VEPVSAALAAVVATHAGYRSVQIINDRFGHDAGDHVIVQIAEICRQQKRKSDVVARFGGEEFLLLLPETQLSEAQVVAERLRQQVEASVLSVASHAINTTVSIGVAQTSSSMKTIFDLIKSPTTPCTRPRMRVEIGCARRRRGRAAGMGRRERLFLWLVLILAASLVVAAMSWLADELGWGGGGAGRRACRTWC